MDENGNVITGFSREDCKEMNDLNSTKPVSYTHLVMSWMEMLCMN